MEEECNSSKLRDNKNNNFGNATKCSCYRLHDTVNQLHAEENSMMSTKGVQCSGEWYLDLGCSTHMTKRKY